MKNNNVFVRSGLIASAIIAVSALIITTGEGGNYQPRTAGPGSAKGAKGAMEYYAMLRNNQVTGTVDIKDVMAAREQVAALARSRSAGLNLVWEELGPDNVGGRTRGFIVDPSNPSIMYAGGVAGGVFRSTNNGGTWSPVSMVDENGFSHNPAVSAITRSADGAIYVGTGEGFTNVDGTNNGSPGFLGLGVFKSTDGINFTRLASTKPADNIASEAWAIVNDIVAHPTEPNKIYAGTQRGLRVTEDGGLTWNEEYLKDNGIILKSTIKDIEIHNDGTTMLVSSSNIFVSSNGNADSFDRKPLSAGDRADVAIAPSNSSVMYAAVSNGGALGGVYYSSDKGETWDVILPGGGTIDPFGSNTQGGYDNIIAVHPANEGEVYFGGVEFWRWKRISTSPLAGDWQKVANEWESPMNPYYIHADKHNIIFHPTDTNIFFVINDGGVFQTNTRGQVYFPQNKGYNVTQFYSVAFSGLGEVIGGTQDNGTQYIDYKHPNGAQGAVEVQGGDGGHVAISQINNKITFSTIYGAQLFRANDAVTMNRFGPAGAGSGLSPFVTPIELWESFDDALSIDSVTFFNDSLSQNIGTGNGAQKTFESTLKPAQAAAQLVRNSVIVKVGTQTLTAINDSVLTGSGSGTIDKDGKIKVTFNAAPGVSTLILAYYDVKYPSGSVINLKSKTANYPFTYTLTSDLNPKDSIKVHDRIQSKFALGGVGGVWVSKRALDFAYDPSWIKAVSFDKIPFGTNLIDDVSKDVAFTPDGNTMFVSTSLGKAIYRINGLSQLRDNMAGNSIPSVLTTEKIKSFSQAITDIAINPNNPNELIVTLGNYGNNSYIEKTTNALDSTVVFTSVQGNLPKMPVYSAVIDVTNGKSVILGTEYGIYATEDITAASPTWVDNNNGMPRVPVFMVRQQTFPSNWDRKITNGGTIYAGTHGRGFFKTNTLADALNSVDELKAKTAKISSLKVYPNPVAANGNLEVTLASAVEKAVITFFDLNGRMIKSTSLGSLKEGNHKINFNVNELPVGTYFVRFEGGEKALTGKLVVIR